VVAGDYRLRRVRYAACPCVCAPAVQLDRMSGNVDEQCDQSSRATAPSCSTVKQQQTSPTAGEPAVSARRAKLSSPRSTKKAWCQRLEMDAAAATSTPRVPVAVTPGTEGGGGVSPQLQQSQLFVCRQCGKYFITLKYLEMHSALHAGQPGTTSSIQPAVQPPPQPVTPVDRSTLPSQPPPPSSLPSAESFLRGAAGAAGAGLPVLLPQRTAATTSRPAVPPPPPRLRDWTCDICRKKFSQNSSFKNHQRTHSDERPFVCTVCSIGFKERYHLKKHTLFKHSSETREQCKVCGKRFKGQSVHFVSCIMLNKPIGNEIVRHIANASLSLTHNNSLYMYIM